MPSFRETILSEVLDWIPGIKRIKPVDIKKYSEKETEKYPFYGQQLINNGVVGYISVQDRFLNNKDSNVYLMIASNNHSINIVTSPFYLKEDHAATSIIGHPKMTLLSALYIKGSIQRVFETSFDYNAKAVQGVLKNTTVTLPFLDEKSKTLDWEYMNKYVKHIEKKYVKLVEEQYVKRIKKHLTSLGYSSIEDTLLSSTDKEILQKYNFSEQKEFPLDELFDRIKRGKRIKSLDRIDGDLPFITAGVDKMGYSSHIGNPEAEVFPENSLTIDMFGNTFYRGYQYGADDHVTILYSHTKKYNKRVLQHIQTHIQKAIAGKFSYSRNFYASDAPEVSIKLPVNQDGQLDTELMDNFIKVLEKKVIHTLDNKMKTELGVLKNINLK